MPGRILLALLARVLMAIPAVQQAIAFSISSRFSFGLLF